MLHLQKVPRMKQILDDSTAGKILLQPIEYDLQIINLSYHLHIYFN